MNLSSARLFAILICFVSLSSFNLSAQVIDLHLVDVVTHDNSPAFRLMVGEDGLRYYDVGRGHRDEFTINGVNYTPPSGHDGSFIVILEEDGQHRRTLDRGGDDRCSLQEEDLICFTSFFEDTLVIYGRAYSNAAFDFFGNNVLVRRLDRQAGEHIDDRQWATTADASSSVQYASYASGHLSIGGFNQMGGFGGGHLVVDSFLLNYGFTWGVFFGGLSEDLSMSWMYPIYSIDYNNIEDVLRTNNGYTYAACRAEGNVYHGDTSNLEMISPSGQSWWFPYIMVFDSTGHLLDIKEFVQHSSDPSAFISSRVRQLQSLSDGRVVALTSCSPCDSLQVDDLHIDLPGDGGPALFLFFDTATQAESFVSLRGSSGYKTITSFVIDAEDRIWFTGISDADTVRMGDAMLILGEDGVRRPFVGLMNADGQGTILQAMPFQSQVGAIDQAGKDVYLARSRRDTTNVYRLSLRPVNTEEANRSGADMALCPSLARSGDIIRLCHRDRSEVSSSDLVLSAEIYSMDGRPVFKQYDGSGLTQLRLEGLVAGMYAVHLTHADGRISQAKLMVE